MQNLHEVFKCRICEEKFSDQLSLNNHLDTTDHGYMETTTTEEAS